MEGVEESIDCTRLGKTCMSRDLTKRSFGGVTEPGEVNYILDTLTQTIKYCGLLKIQSSNEIDISGCMEPITRTCFCAL